MPESPIAKLTIKKANDKDRDAGWDDPELCRGPQALLAYIIKYLFVDVGEFADLANVVLSSSRPSDSDAGKIWAKTSEPYGVGIYSGGWKMVYQYPQSTPFLFDQGAGFPTFLSKMSTSEVSGAGLGQPTDSKWVWVIFRPQPYN